MLLQIKLVLKKYRFIIIKEIIECILTEGELNMKKILYLCVCMVLIFTNNFTVMAEEQNSYILDYGSNSISNAKIKSYDEIMNFDLAFGNPEAPIKIVEYFSLQCPHCRDFYLDTHDYLVDKINSGEIYFVLKHIDISRFKYDGYIFDRIDNINSLDTIEYIYKNFDVWTSYNDYSDVDDFFKLNNTNIERTIYENINYKVFKALGLKGVPSVVINGTIPDDEIKNLEDLKMAISKIQ